MLRNKFFKNKGNNYNLCNTLKNIVYENKNCFFSNSNFKFCFLH